MWRNIVWNLQCLPHCNAQDTPVSLSVGECVSLHKGPQSMWCALYQCWKVRWALRHVLNYKLGAQVVWKMCSFEQRVFICNICAEYVYGKNFIERFLKDTMHCKCHVKEYIQIVRKILNRVGDGWKQIWKCFVITEEKIEWYCTQMETNIRKSLCLLDVQIGVWKLQFSVWQNF